MTKPFKFLVTGAAGFVGAHLAAELKRSGHEVLGIDNFNPYYSAELKRIRVEKLLVPLGVNVQDLDLSDFLGLQGVITKFQPDTVIHLAARPGVRTPLNQSTKYIQDNIVAFTNVLQCAVVNSIPNFLYASSSSVYGNSKANIYSEEDNSITPISIYGATKRANEILASTYAANSQTRTRGLRFFTVYGPWGRPDMAYFRLIAAAINKSEFMKFGTGNIRRDFTYIDDIVRAIQALAKNLATQPQGFNDVVNIGGGNPHSLNDLIEEISTQFGSIIDAQLMDGNSNDTEYTCANTEKLFQLIGLRPEVSLKDGVAETIKWAKGSDISPQLANWVDSSI